MRVLFPLAEPILAGKARFVAIVNTAAALARAGAEVRLMLPGPADAPRRYAEEHLGIAWPAGLEVVRIGGWHRELGHWFTWNRVTIGAALRAIDEDRGSGPTVVLVRHEKLALALSARRRPPRFVFEAHTIPADYERELGRSRDRVDTVDMRTGMILAGAAGLAAISQGLLDELVRRYEFLGPTAVARSGIDLERFPHAWSPGPRAGGPTIVYVGRLGAWKGVLSLVEAAGRIPGARLRLVGGGDADEVARIREAARAAGAEARVEITGRVGNKDVAPILAAADVAVHALPAELSIATRDTSPLKLLEYLAVGVPVVAPDVPAIREIVEDGKSAVLAPPGDPDALASALRRVLEDPALQRRLSEQGLEVARRHTWDRRALALLGLFRAAVEVPAHAPNSPGKVSEPPKTVDLVAGDGVRWRVDERAVRVLFDGGKLLLERRVLARTRLRDTRSRRIDRVDLESGSVLVKSYLASPLEGVVRRLGDAPAEVEFDNARELRRLGFAVPEPLACGRTVRAFSLRESTLITGFADGAVDLVALAHDPALGGGGRRELIDAVADIASRLHAAGVKHEDLHLGNILVDRSAGKPSLILIDVRRVRFGGALDWTDRTEALALLGLAAHGLVSATERLRFFRRYLGATPPTEDPKVLARRIERRTGDLAAVMAYRRASSAVRGDSRFQEHAANGARWMVRIRDASPELSRILDDPEAFVAAPGRYVVEEKPTRGQAMRVLERSVLLGGLGVRTIEVVAAGLARSGRRYVVRLAMPGAVPLADKLGNPGEGLALVRAAGKLIAELHGRAISDYDAFAAGFQVGPDGALILTRIDGLSIHEGVYEDYAAIELADLAKELRRHPAARPEWIDALVDGYLERRPVRDAAAFRRAVGA